MKLEKYDEVGAPAKKKKKTSLIDGGREKPKGKEWQ